MKIIPLPFAAAFAALTLTLSSQVMANEPAASTVTPEEALARLKAGNGRFVAGKAEHPHQGADRRAELSTSQHPFAIVLGCADSRTSPEVVFDQGLGDVFTIRVAGNILDDETIGSIEYAVEHLGSPLIVVLGHKRCGAVKAARDLIAADKQAPGHIQSLINRIAPAVATTASADAETTCKRNVLNVAQALRECGPILNEAFTKGKITVVGAHYDLDSGAVEFLKDEPAKAATTAAVR